MDAAVISALEQGHIGDIRYLVAFDLDSGTLRYTTHSDDVTYEGDTYSPLGAIGGFGSFKETKELDPADYEVRIGTSDPTILATFANEPLINRQCTILQVILNEDFTVLGEMTRISGILQPASINYGGKSSITIPVKDQLADWDRNISVLYTDAEQKRIDPTDNSLEHVSEIARRDIIWPAASYYD